MALRTNREGAGCRGAFQFRWDWAVKAFRGGIAAILARVWEVLEALMGSSCARPCTVLAREFVYKLFEVVSFTKWIALKYVAAMLAGL
jgi:hypothetical protein